MDDQPLSCPQCQSIDQVQKVSAIYNMGRTYTTSVFSNRPIPMASNNMSRSYLQGMLRPPIMTRLLWKKILPPLILVAILEAAVVLVTESGIFSIGGISSSFFTIPAICIITILSALPLSKYLKGWRNGLVKDVQPGLQIWDKLFYCHRCDLVFNPDTRESVPPTRIQELYQAASADTTYST